MVKFASVSHISLFRRHKLETVLPLEAQTFSFVRRAACVTLASVFVEILPHNEQISRILYLCKDEDLREKNT